MEARQHLDRQMGSGADPVQTLREYRRLAPWNLQDLVAVVGAILEATGLRPTSAAASVYPSARTVRYYVAMGLMSPPKGKGAAATYSYSHLLQLLAIKSRQMEGATLATIGDDLHKHTADHLERQLGASLGPHLVSPSHLAISDPSTARGKSGRALQAWHALGEEVEVELKETGRTFAITKWHRIPIVRGVELQVHEGHPLASRTEHSQAIADAVRRALNRVLVEPE